MDGCVNLILHVMDKDRQKEPKQNQVLIVRGEGIRDQRGLKIYTVKQEIISLVGERDEAKGREEVLCPIHIVN